QRHLPRGGPGAAVIRHLLVIGGQRCGTTYLYTVLDAHPQIVMARPMRPEPKVFLSDEASARGLDWYRATYFADAGGSADPGGSADTGGEVLLGEKSTSYLECPDAAPRAAAMLGGAQIVALLREPVARAISNWQFSTANGYEDRPLEQALADNLDSGRDWDRATTSVSPFAYLERGRYADHLQPWLETFGDAASGGAYEGRVHLRFFEELVGDADAVRELYAALGVDPQFRPSAAAERVNQSDAEAPVLPPRLLSRLQEYFAVSNEHLRRLLDRELPPSW